MGQLIRYRPELFYADERKFAARAGLTVAEIIAAVPERAEEFEAWGVVTINGEICPREMWRHVMPKPEATVRLHLCPGPGGGGASESGGGSSGKNTFALVATIAILAATMWIGGGGLVALGFSQAAFGAGTFGAQAAALAIGAAGTLAVAALAPPPLAPNIANNPNQGRSNLSPVIAGIVGNPFSPFDGMPRVVGEMRVSPPWLTPPYTTMVDRVVRAHGIAGVIGPTDVSSSVFINGNNLTLLDPDIYDFELKTGDPADTAFTLSAEVVVEQPANFALTEYILQSTTGNELKLADQTTPDNSRPQWHYFTSRSSAANPMAEAWFRLLWPQGISTTSINGTYMPLQLRFRKVGTVTWNDLPECWVLCEGSGSGQTPFRQLIRLIWYTVLPGGLSNINAQKVGASIAYGRTPTFTAGANWEVVGSSGASIYDDTAERVNAVFNGFDIYIPAASFPTTDKYEFGIRRGLAVAEVFHTDTYKRIATLINPFADSGASPNIAIASILDQQAAQSLCILEQMAFKYSEAPLATEIKAAGVAVQINSFVLESLSFLARAKSRVVDPVAASIWGEPNIWTVPDVWNIATYGAASDTLTQNPADWFVEILTGGQNSRAVADSMIDWTNIADWWHYCNRNNLEVNFVAQNLTVEQALQIVAAAGHATVRRNQKWGVYIERDTSADTPIQIFTPNNSSGFSVEKAFSDVPHAFRVEWYDESNNFEQAGGLVYQDGFTSANATLFEAMRYDGITKGTLVSIRALIDLRQLLYRQTRYSLTIGVQSLIAGRGDLVGLMNDVVKFNHRFARIRRVIENDGGAQIGLELDAAVDLPSGTISVVMQLADNTTRTQQIVESNGRYRTITFTTPLSLVDVVDEDGITVKPIRARNVVGLGPSTQQLIRAKIFDIKPGKDYTAQLTLVDEAPQIFTGLGLLL